MNVPVVEGSGSDLGPEPELAARQIVRFTYLQNVKVAAILYFIISFVYVPVGIIGAVFATSDEDRLGFIGMIAMPLIMPVVMAIFLPIVIAIYNGLAKVIGGFEYVSQAMPDLQDSSRADL